MIEIKKRYYLVSNDEGGEIIHDFRSNIKFGTKWSRLVGRDTLEELIKDQGIPDEPCKICNSPFSTCYYEPIKSQLKSKNICFTCNYWDERKVDLKDKNFFIINGEAYYLLADNPKGVFQGFGGRKFTIQRFDSDEQIVTHNLWFNGKVPERFLKDFPDNARFV